MSIIITTALIITFSAPISGLAIRFYRERNHFKAKTMKAENALTELLLPEENKGFEYTKKYVYGSPDWCVFCGDSFLYKGGVRLPQMEKQSKFCEGKCEKMKAEHIHTKCCFCNGNIISLPWHKKPK